MKVLQAFKVYVPHRGGIVSTIQTLCEGLGDGAEMSVLASFPCGVGRHEIINGVEVRRTTSLGELLAMPIAPTYPVQFWRAAYQSDVVGYHFPFPLVDLAVSLHFPAHVGLVIHWHSEIVSQQRIGQLFAPLIQRCLSRADRIVVSTPHHLQISRYLGEVADKCTVIPFGIDVDRWQRLDDDERQAIDRVRAEYNGFILAVGRLVPYKGVDVLIRAMPRISGRLIIVGNGPLRQDLLRLAMGLGVANRVTFAGDVGFQQLKALMHACRFFVLPSSAANETFGIVQLEAMACGKAIINTDAHPGIGWVARHGQEALTVRARDSNALASAIERLYDQPDEAIRLGAQGRVRVRESFTLARFFAKTLAVYQAAARARSEG